jgi:Tol biopolymer transport system component
VDPQNATQITSGNETIEGFALSPDGRWLAYDSDRSGNGDIWKVSVDGGPAQQLTTSPTGDYVQDFSPDGHELAFHALRDGVRHIFVMHADGTGIQSGDRQPETGGQPGLLAGRQFAGVRRLEHARRDDVQPVSGIAPAAGRPLGRTSRARGAGQ